MFKNVTMAKKTNEKKEKTNGHHELFQQEPHNMFRVRDKALERIF